MLTSNLTVLEARMKGLDLTIQELSQELARFYLQQLDGESENPSKTMGDFWEWRRTYIEGYRELLQERSTVRAAIQSAK